MHRGNGKPRVHARDHEHGGADPTLIVYEDVGDEGGGGGTGIQFEVDPQTGGWLTVETTGTIDGTPTGFGIIMVADAGDFELNAAAHDMLVIAGRDIVETTGRDYRVTADRDIVFAADGDLTLRAVGGYIYFPFIPTSDPHVGGALWSNGGVLTLSSG